MEVFFEKEPKPINIKEKPQFLSLPKSVNLKQINDFAKKYIKYKNIIVLGTGGSVITLELLYEALKPKKNLFILDSTHTEEVKDVLNKCKKSDSLVFVISQSGSTLETLSLYLLFKDYKCIFITRGGILKEISKLNKIETYEFPEIAGRYSGISNVSFLPAVLLNLNIEKIIEGSLDFFLKESEKALKSASFIFSNYKKNKTELFLSSYSDRLNSFNYFCSQLFLESLGKNNKSITFCSRKAPRMQHEAIQRILGGKKNLQVMLLKVNDSKNSLKITVPNNLTSLLGFLDNKTSNQIINSEFEGTKKSIIEKKIPLFVVELNSLDEYELGKLISFTQLTIFYLAKLMKVNPYDNPEVDKGKDFTLNFLKNSTCPEY